MIKAFADWLTYTVFKMTANTHLADAVNFFVYDTIKIILMLTVIIYIGSIIRSFFPPEKVKKLLAQKSEFVGNILASLLGIVTPFCSCSAVPVFIGFLEAGVPLGVTMSFLIASPMINEVALVLLWGLFGAKIALIYYRRRHVRSDYCRLYPRAHPCRRKNGRRLCVGDPDG